MMHIGDARARRADGATHADLLRSALAAALAVATASTAHATDYPWCYVDQTMSGATSCYFATLAQCRASTGGNGGFCVRNPAYRAAIDTYAPRPPRRHR